MKKLFLLITLVIVSNFIIGQRKHWITSYGQKTKKSLASGYYTIKKGKTNNLYLKETYLFDYESPYEHTHYQTQKCMVKEGSYIAFNKNGSIKEQGAYHNNKKTGEWVYFNTQGEKQSIVNYTDDIKHGIYFDYKDNKITSGTYKNGLKDQLWSTASTSGISIEAVFYKDGKKHGDATYYHNNGRVREVNSYKQGVLISTRRFDRNGVELIEEEVLEEDFPVFTVVEQQPEFPGGSSKMMRYIGNKVQYPQIAIENKIEGRVYIRFIVEKDGSISNVEAIRSPHESLEKEAIRVVSNMPKWTPAKQRGKNVRAQFTLPINFRLH